MLPGMLAKDLICENSFLTRKLDMVQILLPGAKDLICESSFLTIQAESSS